jgi:phenylacetate-CoA ligase
MRKSIEKAFGCQVFDHYGSREIGSIASECEEHSGYHIAAENVVVEFVKDDEHVSQGEDGVILLTGLRNYGMPFIRYQIGDVGSPSKETCNCGRGLPLMKSVKGRISQFFVVCDENSGKTTPVDMSLLMEYIMIHLKSRPDSYRAIQERRDYIRVEIVQSKSYSPQDTNFLVEQLHKYLGASVKIEIKFVDVLPPLPSGKRSQFISKVSAFNT